MLKSIISKLFPLDGLSIVSRSRGTDLEVNGLPRDFLPVNCEILETGIEKHGNMQITHYLTHVGDYVVYLTVCAPGFGESKFALIRGVAQADSDIAEDVRRHARSRISSVCSALHTGSQTRTA